MAQPHINNPKSFGLLVAGGFHANQMRHVWVSHRLHKVISFENVEDSIPGDLQRWIDQPDPGGGWHFASNEILSPDTREAILRELGEWPS